MIRTSAKVLGQCTLLLAGMAFVVTASLFVVGSFMVTWPILRLSPRDQRVTAAVNSVQAALQLVTAFKK